MEKSVYTDFILKNIPRIITQIDRDEHSITYGSCDRNHWHLKIRDFTSAILQQSGLTLALLYQIGFDGNIYYQVENIKKWAESTIYYWGKIQLPDGSYNEYYPYEHGFPPTAFSLYSACEIYKCLSMNNEYLMNKMKKSAKYLASHMEQGAFNQEMAAITALYDVYTVTGEQWVLEAATMRLDRILNLQSQEGWFLEYGGADIGYLSVTLDMLAEYYHMSRDRKAEEPIHRIIKFVKYFIHPDATIGGEYGSRNTTYFLPNGLEVALQMGNSEAAAIKDKLYRNSSVYNFFMDSVDDRYFSHYLIHSFLRALEKERVFNKVHSIVPVALPCHTPHEQYFQDSGLLSYKNASYYAVVALKKGGVIKVFNDKQEIFINCGYRISEGKGTTATTNWQAPSYEISYTNKKASTRGKMTQVSLKTSTPLMHIGLRMVAFVMGNKIIGFLKKMLIFVDKHNDIFFSREIEFKEGEVVISDILDSPYSVDLEKASNMSLRHVASGKFFALSDLISSNQEKYLQVTKIKIVWRLDISTGTVEVYYEKLA